MQKRLFQLLAAVLIALPFARAHANEYTDTIRVFRNAGESGKFFAKSYGYAVFPKVYKGAFFVGGAYGKGQVFEKGRQRQLGLVPYEMVDAVKFLAFDLK